MQDTTVVDSYVKSYIVEDKQKFPLNLGMLFFLKIRFSGAGYLRGSVVYFVLDLYRPEFAFLCWVFAWWFGGRLGGSSYVKWSGFCQVRVKLNSYN